MERESRLFQFYEAPVRTVQGGRVMDIKAAYQYITLHQGAMAHTHEFRNMIQAVREGSTDEKAVRQYKAEHFDFACFSGTFSYRRDEGLVAHSGLICLDFDHVGRGSALSSLRNRLIGDRYFTTQLLFTSPSGDGLKWVVDIDLSKCDHRTWFRALQNYVRATYGVATDEKCVNVSRCCFLPHDSGCYVNPITLTEPDVCPF